LVIIHLSQIIRKLLNARNVHLAFTVTVPDYQNLLDNVLKDIIAPQEVRVRIRCHALQEPTSGTKRLRHLESADHALLVNIALKQPLSPSSAQLVLMEIGQTWSKSKIVKHVQLDISALLMV